jgi:hypothetical protein
MQIGSNRTDDNYVSLRAKLVLTNLVINSMLKQKATFEYHITFHPRCVKAIENC